MRSLHRPPRPWLAAGVLVLASLLSACGGGGGGGGGGGLPIVGGNPPTNTTAELPSREALIAAVARALDGRPPAEIAERSAQ